MKEETFIAKALTDHPKIDSISKPALIAWFRCNSCPSCRFREEVIDPDPKKTIHWCARTHDRYGIIDMVAESFDDKENYVTKRTCLWLKGLEPLRTNDLPKPNNKELFGCHPSGKARDWESQIMKDRSKNRSKTFPGVAKAMAEQWAGKLEETT